MEKTIYTIGYQTIKHPGLLKKAAVKHNLCVVDCRIQPQSRFQPGWNRAALQEFFGERYTHVREFGNVNYKNGGPVKLVDAAAGIVRAVTLLEKFDGVILMCTCKQHQTCHRLNAAEALAEATGLPVIHLNPVSLAALNGGSDGKPPVWQPVLF